MASAGRVLVLELNEITWDLLDPLMKEGRLPHISRLVREGARADAWADEQAKHLDPWVTWTTVYTGVPQHVHGLSMLEQDRESLGAPRVWEYAQDAGKRLGLFGSANTWPPQRVDGFWVPGSFARDFQTFPRELEPIQAMNVGRAECRERDRMSGEPHRDRNPHGVDQHGRRIARQQGDTQNSRHRHSVSNAVEQGERQHAERGNHEVDARA
jgi:hypothetical protein